MPQLPAGFVPDGFVPDAAAPAAPVAPSGTWEDRGVAGRVWRPAVQGGSERTREDNSLLGMPPELAVVSGLGLARAVTGAGLTAAQRGVAGVKNVVTQVSPIVKYELARGALEHAGIPTAVAVPMAIAFSGYKKGAKAAPAAAEATAAETAVSTAGYPRGGPIAPAPVASAPAAAAAVDEFTLARTARQAPKNAYPDQRALNDEALAAARDRYRASQQATPAMTEKIVAASGKMKLTSGEFKEFTRLMQQKGMTLPKAEAGVKAARELAAKLGGATSEEVAKAVAHMQATGKW